jgi:peptide/nickel transport system substrate-binding protein
MTKAEASGRVTSGVAGRLGRFAGLALLAVLLAAGPCRADVMVPAFTPEQIGGTLRGNFNAEPQTLNPLTYKDLYGRIVNEYVIEYLIDRDWDTLEFKGILADRWEVSPDGLTVTFHLNPKATFSDQTPVTADDVVFTYETVMNPKIDCRNVASSYEDCKACEKVDDRTVRFIWKKPFFLSLENSGGLGVLPKHVYQFKDPKEFNDLNDVLVGSGPYTFSKGDWKTGQHLILRRNEHYWGNRPSFDQIVYRFILRDREDVKSGFNLFRYSTPKNGYNYIGWNNERPPFNDPRVRRAMTHLVWREQILKHMWYDVGSIATGPFWSQSPQDDKTIKPWPFDREAARKLLKEAGWEDRNGDGWLENAAGQRFEFEFCSASGDQLTRDMVRVIGEEFRRMGIDMHVRLYEWSIFTVKLDNHDFDCIMLSWGGGGVEDDPFQIWHSSQIADRGSNFISYRNAEADRIIEVARATLDVPKRMELWHQLQQLLHREHKMGMFPIEWWVGKDAAAPAEGKAP